MSDDELTPRPKRRRAARAPPPAVCAPRECEALESALPRFFELARALARDVLRLERAVKAGDIVESMQLMQVLIEDQALCETVEDDALLRVRGRYTEWLVSQRHPPGAAEDPGGPD